MIIKNLRHVLKNLANRVKNKLKTSKKIRFDSDRKRNEKRKAILVLNNNETEIPFCNIKSGMNIKLFESDGSQVTDKIFKVINDAYLNKHNIWTFETDSI